MTSDFLKIDEFLTDDERAVRDRVRRFCDEEIIPIIGDYWDRGEFPKQLVPKLAALNVAGDGIDGYGCPGLSPVAVGLMNQELARGDASIHSFFGSHSSMAMAAIARFGSHQQKEHWLPPMARLESIGAFALTEPDRGSDVARLETSARLKGDSYRLNGAKRFIGNGSIADVLVVFARGDDGHVGGFLVEPGPGLTALPLTGKLAKRAGDQAHVAFANVRIPIEARLPGVRTFRDTAEILTLQRSINAWESVGHAIAAYEAALEYCAERHQFARPLTSFQLVQEKLASMLSGICAMQLMALRVTQLGAQGEMTPAMSSVAKMHNARGARQILADARDLLGGNGILIERHVARHMADFEATFTYDGTDHIQTLIIGREVTGEQAFAPVP